MSKLIHSRRKFLGGMATLAGAGITPFALNLAAMSSAAAENAADYKAIVCLFMAGGNDHFNTVLPTDSSSWNEYQRLRASADSGSIALPAVGASGGVLPIVPINTQGRSFALHPSMAPLKALFDAGRAAVVANVGTLVQPTTLSQYKTQSVALPPKLFSHNDQQAVWQSLQPENSGTVGWGGRMVDMLAAANSSATFSAISSAGRATFLGGKTFNQLQVEASGMPAINTLSEPLFGIPGQYAPMPSIIAADNIDPLMKEHANVVKSAIAAQAKLAASLPPKGSSGVPDPTAYTNPLTGKSGVNPLALQLQMVARLIAARDSLGLRRQVFYVSLGGFDSHDGQIAKQADLLAKVAHAMAYFDTAMTSLQGVDMRNQVTLFTASDFGRTFASNGDGSDHGWGSHHFVMGGAVKGRDIYGSMPVSGVGHNLDVGSGALLPTISVDQYGATLAKWFGLSATQVADVFPNIGNFSTRDLGFMKV